MAQSTPKDFQEAGPGHGLIHNEGRTLGDLPEVVRVKCHRREQEGRVPRELVGVEVKEHLQNALPRHSQRRHTPLVARPRALFPRLALGAHELKAKAVRSHKL